MATQPIGNIETRIRQVERRNQKAEKAQKAKRATNVFEQAQNNSNLEVQAAREKRRAAKAHQRAMEFKKKNAPQTTQTVANTGNKVSKLGNKLMKRGKLAAVAGLALVGLGALLFTSNDKKATGAAGTPTDPTPDTPVPAPADTTKTDTTVTPAPADTVKTDKKLADTIPAPVAPMPADNTKTTPADTTDTAKAAQATGGKTDLDWDKIPYKVDFPELNKKPEQVADDKTDLDWDKIPYKVDFPELNKKPEQDDNVLPFPYIKQPEVADEAPKAEVANEYKVVKGDNVWNIAKAHLREINGAEPTNKEILYETRRIMKLNGIKLEPDHYHAKIYPNDIIKFN